ncbi:MAG: dihydrodipicolinate synthase family protein [Chloroflexota bacterium]|nr:dihydrodipicolinate synthase family protein [Chloroflexota bacterium]
MPHEMIVAAVTPLTDAGRRLDEAAIGPMVAFLEEQGADGLFACGTTGEGILLSIDERQRAAVAFRAALRGRLIVHCGAQTTADTVELARHAVEIGADAVGVIPPPYYQLDHEALTEHFVSAARACAPLPLYLYAFTARSGYPLPVDVVREVARRVENIAGLKVSESQFERVEPYLGLGLPVYVGSEPLIPRALAAGASGAVSGIAAAFPDVVRAVVDDPTPDGERRLTELRSALEGQPFISAIKVALAGRGLPIQPDVRAPLRRLSAAEVTRVESILRGLFAAA